MEKDFEGSITILCQDSQEAYLLRPLNLIETDIFNDDDIWFGNVSNDARHLLFI